MKSIKSKRHTAPYIIHKYFARRPYSLFEHLVAEYSRVGNTIYDPFAGGGVSVYEAVRQQRNAIGCDINPLSIFICERMLSRDHGREFQESVEDLYLYLEKLYAEYFFVSCKCGKNAVPELMEACYTADCPRCGSTIEFGNKDKVKTATYKCLSCENSFIAHKCNRTGYKYLTAQYYCECSKNIQKRNLTLDEIDKLELSIREYNKVCKKKGVTWPNDEIPDYWDRQAEDGLKKKGFDLFSDLFTKKNLLVNSSLLYEINRLDVSRQTYLNLRLVYSASLKDTSKLSMVTDDWQQGKPVTWSKHAYWIPSQFCEVNVKSAFRRAVDRFNNSCSYNQVFLPKHKIYKSYDAFHKNSGLRVLLMNKDSSSVAIKNGSVDLILTDPPYGSNVQYNELTSFWHVWNKDIYNSNYYEPREAVVNRKKAIPNSKTFEHYESVLTDIMVNNYKVLKPGGMMILTFNNNNFKSWISILFSICKAGFDIEVEKLHFQPGVKNYKQTAHTISQGAIHGDFVLVFRKKGNKNKTKKIDPKNISISIKRDMDTAVKDKSLSSEEFHDRFVFYYKKLLPDLWIYLNSISSEKSIEEITVEIMGE
jgi:adenine-specific DNA methylase